MSGHTPGPWALSKDGSSERKNQANCIQGADGTLIVYGQANDADARLIASAPDLLCELKRVMSWIDNWSPEFSNDPDWPTDRDAARAAIAKATGEAA